METYIIALIGVAGVVIGSLISGAFQLIVTEKSVKNAQFQFDKTMEQARLEFASKLKQIQDEQKRVAIEKATKEFEASNDRFYTNMLRGIQLYERLFNELHYLNNISHPNCEQRRLDAMAYPHIANAICDIVGDVSLHQDIANLLGALRCNIDMYNASLDAHADSKMLENFLKEIYKLILPINEEGFRNYALIQSQLRKHEEEVGKQHLQQ